MEGTTRLEIREEHAPAALALATGEAETREAAPIGTSAA
jgi:hypothetical protein